MVRMTKGRYLYTRVRRASVDLRDGIVATIFSSCESLYRVQVM